MSFTCRHWTSLIISFIIFQGSVILGNDEVLSNLSNKISNSNWIKIDCKVVQIQGNDTWAHQVNIHSFGKDEYQITAEDQIIQVKQDTVWTFLTKSKQLTIDRFYRDVPNVFYFLTGDFTGLDILGSENSGNFTIINFKDALSGYTGIIKIDTTTNVPKKLEIDLDSISKIVVNINSFTVDSGEPPVFYIHGNNWEVIDLRE